MNAQAIAGVDRGPEAPHLLKDQPVEEYRLELIDLAWQAATAYPINPHIKNRGRAEEHVVQGALGINQPHLAWGYAKKVVNWRRGACYAEIAHYLIEQGETEHVEYFLKQAILHSKDAKQGWRHARVKTRVAAARLLVGNEKGAAGLVEDQDFAGQGEQISAKAVSATDEEFIELVAALDKMVKLEGYDEIWAAMQGYAQLYRHHYSNPTRRSLLLKKLRLAWEDMPGIRRLEVMLQFADAALENDDQQAAKTHIDEADEIRQSFRWTIDYDLRLRADIARYRTGVGQSDAVRVLLEESVKLADEKLESLQNFYRADALRPIAEAFAVLGDEEGSLEIYRRVVEVGALNPNIRPRVSDITASCVSMALHDIKPDAELISEIQQIVDGLKK
ncbi:MAG: hypothetical protein KTR15_15850 [Phycisphaeraceae bacterium]|nr:hypothetical protein [Phycisphaeraceae bacterium]